MSQFKLVYSDDCTRITGTPAGLVPPAEAFFSAGTVAVDPRNPSLLVSITLNSEDIDDLSGVARILTDSRDLTAPLDAPFPVDVEQTSRLRNLKRLAFAQWFAQWTSIPVERGLVRCDVAAAAWRAGQYVYAHEIFNEETTFLIDLLRTEERCVSDDEREALRAMVETCIEALGPEDPRCETLRSLAAQCSVHEVALGASPPVVYHDVPSILDPGTVDWEMVPPRTFSTDDGNILWTQEGDDITVTVSTHPHLDPTSPALDRLIVRLVEPETGQTVIASDLALTDRPGGGQVFKTVIPAPGLDPSELIPDVTDVRGLKPPRIGPAADVALVERVMVRATDRTRAAAIAQSQRLDPGQFAQRAAQAVNRAEKELEGIDNNEDVAAATRLNALQWCDAAAHDPRAATGLDTLEGAALLSELVAVARVVRAQAAQN